MIFVALLLMGAVAAAQLLPPVPSASSSALTIRGQVVADNDAALRRARVAVAGVAAAGAPVLTDDDGRFAVTVPAAVSGPVTLTIAKAGFATSSIVMTRTDLASSRALLVRLARGAAIAGRIVDAAGAPVPYALVGARFDDPAAPDAAPAPPWLAESDDLGEFRIGGLAAGRYSVAVFGAPTTQRDSLARLTDRLLQNPAATLPAAVTGSSVVVLRAGDAATVNFSVTAPEAIPPPTLNGSAAQQGTGAVTGRVLSVGGGPLAGALVRVMRNGFAARFAPSGPDGRFIVRDLPAGSFTVEASRTGFITLQYGQRTGGQSGRPVTVRDGETLDRIDIILPTGAAVTGTLVDEAGEPIAGVSVRALQVRLMGDLRAAVDVPGVRERQTDDLGRYRLFGLLPGRYLVVASMDAEAAAATATQDAGGYAPIFYPGTPAIAQALPLELETSTAVTADLVFTRSPTARVTGHAFDADGRPLRSGVLLFESQQSGGIMLQPRKAGLATDGAFVFTNVPPGTYVVQVMTGVPGATPRAGPGAPAIHFGMQYVRVPDGGGDPLPVRVQASPGPTVTGRIVFEGGAVPPPRIAVWTFPADFDRAPVIGSGPSGLTMDDADRFTVVGATGLRRFVLQTAPPGWFLKSATVNGADAMDAPFDFGLEERTFTDAEVVVSSAGAAIAGGLSEAVGQRPADYAVIVFATERHRWFRMSPALKLARADQDGRYRVDALPPGDYWVAAVDRIEGTPSSGEWHDPVFLEGLTRRARRVTLVESQVTAMDLPLIVR